MGRKKRKSAKGDKENIGLHSAITSQDFDINEKKDNSIWWSIGLLLFMSCICTIWFITTF